MSTETTGGISSLMDFKATTWTAADAVSASFTILNGFIYFLFEDTAPAPDEFRLYRYDLTNREWSPSSWQSTLQGLSGGNPARYQELVATYKKDHPSLSQSAYQQGASQAKSAVYSQDIQVNRAAVVNSTYAFNNIKTHLNTIHALSQKIDQAKNTKSAMDLNSRLVAELAYIQTQELKMQILMNQQMAQASADSIAAKTASAKFSSISN